MINEGLSVIFKLLSNSIQHDSSFDSYGFQWVNRVGLAKWVGLTNLGWEKVRNTWIFIWNDHGSLIQVKFHQYLI